MVASVGAVVGAAGGVGTTRLSVEVGAALAADGRDVIVLDTALDTQGLSSYVPGRIDPDLTDVLTSGLDPAEALLTHPASDVTAGTLRCLPVDATFDRIAQTKTPETARDLTELATDLTSDGTHIVVDVPPLASNTAVAGTAAADRIALATRDSARGRDALSQSLGTLDDLGFEATLTVINRVRAGNPPDADVTIPESTRSGVPTTPACLSGDTEFVTAVERLASMLFDTKISVDLDRDLARAARDLLQ